MIDIHFFQGVVTLVFMILFVYVTCWSFSKKRKAEFKYAENIPLCDDGPIVPSDGESS